MRPAKFAQANKTLIKPSDMTDEECESLPVYTDGKICLSHWRGSFFERVQFLLTGKVWIWIHSGWTQPPVSISTENPWG